MKDVLCTGVVVTQAEGGNWWDKTWEVEYHYYGEVTPGEPGWSIERNDPNTEAAAYNLAGQYKANTVAVEKHACTNRCRLSAELVQGGWLIREYDYNLWSKVIPHMKGA